MKEKAKAAVMAAFAADSLALGVHWIYNTRVIDKKLGRVQTLLKPGIAKFHAGKERGQFTHYGDQMFVLLESLADSGEFDLERFAGKWRSLFDGYRGYLDHATQDTLGFFAAGEGPETSGSGSTDLGGACRIAPLLAFHGGDLQRLVAASRAQTAMTHQHPDVVNSAEFFARAARMVLDGMEPTGALEAAATQSPGNFGNLVEAGKNSADKDTRQAIAEFGQACEVKAAFPSVVHLVYRYSDNLKEALVENIMAGGDSAARGMLVGMLLGASQGRGAIPREWLEELDRYPDILRLLNEA